MRPTVEEPVRSDAYRIVIIALGPGLAACTVTWLCLVDSAARLPPPLPVSAFALLLACALPGLPAMALALLRLLPRRPVPRSFGSVAIAAGIYLLAPLWHLILLEIVFWIAQGRHALAGHMSLLLIAWATLGVTTASVWWVYLWGGRRRAGGAGPA